MAEPITPELVCPHAVVGEEGTGACSLAEAAIRERDELTAALREMRDAFLECTGQYAQDLAYDGLATAARLLGEDDLPERRVCESCGKAPAEPGEGICLVCDGADIATGVGESGG